MADAPSPPIPQTQTVRLAALYARGTWSAPASSSAAPAPAPAAAPAAPAAPRFFSKTEALAARYHRLDAARRLPPAPSPAAAPAPPAASDGTPPAATAPDPAAGAPPELAPPPGIDATDPVFIGVKELAQQGGLDREKAGKVLELHQRVQAAGDKALEAMHQRWVETAKADEKIGGDNFSVAMADARSALREFATPELHRVLGAFNLSVHPEVVRLLARVSRELHRARSL